MLTGGKFFALLLSRETRVSRSPRSPICSPKIRKNTLFLQAKVRHENIDHLRSHRPRSFWSELRIATSGKVQHIPEVRLPVTLRMPSNKSDWLRIRIDYSAHTPKIDTSQDRAEKRMRMSSICAGKLGIIRWNHSKSRVRAAKMQLVNNYAHKGSIK